MQKSYVNFRVLGHVVRSVVAFDQLYLSSGSTPDSPPLCGFKEGLPGIIPKSEIYASVCARYV